MIPCLWPWFPKVWFQSSSRLTQIKCYFPVLSLPRVIVSPRNQIIYKGLYLSPESLGQTDSKEVPSCLLLLFLPLWEPLPGVEGIFAWLRTMQNNNVTDNTSSMTSHSLLLRPMIWVWLVPQRPCVGACAQCGSLGGPLWGGVEWEEWGHVSPC